MDNFVAVAGLAVWPAGFGGGGLSALIDARRSVGGLGTGVFGADGSGVLGGAGGGLGGAATLVLGSRALVLGGGALGLGGGGFTASLLGGKGRFSGDDRS